MKNKMLFFSFLLVAATASARKTTTSNKADNSSINIRDSGALTADEQAYGSSRDVEITRLIRRDLVRDKALSTYAQNIKIITLNGKVDLRGPVRSAAEKIMIEAYAKKTAGARNVTNELDVAQ